MLTAMQSERFATRTVHFLSFITETWAEKENVKEYFHHGGAAGVSPGHVTVWATATAVLTRPGHRLDLKYILEKLWKIMAEYVKTKLFIMY